MTTILDLVKSQSEAISANTAAIVALTEKVGAVSGGDNTAVLAAIADLKTTGDKVASDTAAIKHDVEGTDTAPAVDAAPAETPAA